MKNPFHLVSCILLLLFSCNQEGSKSSASYSKQDLRKINWIQGNWKGMDGTNPFYEIYKITNDSTLEIISYQWNGTDSSGSSQSLMKWNNGHYYLGDSLNYKVISITDTSIAMDVNYKANNTILWRKNDQNGWDAILEAKQGKKMYHMEKVDHFK